ncbi:MAG: hypothetical protein ACYC1Q_12695 [Bacteroidia bacterium]
MEIDEEAANLILDTYRKIHALKALLQEVSNSQWGDFAESGTKLSWMMDKILEDKPVQDVMEDLSETIQYTNTLINRSTQMPGLGVRNQLKIEGDLKAILTDLKTFQAKIKK